MYRKERTLREHRSQTDNKNPSFSSSLLDEIYRSMDEKDIGETKRFRETMGRKQSKSSAKWNRDFEEEGTVKSALRRACLVEKWIDKKVNENISSRRGQNRTELVRKIKGDCEHDQEVLVFSSTSISSDSSSGGLSSSDTESMYGVRSQASCFAPPRPNPIRTSVSAKSNTTLKAEEKQNTLFFERREMHYPEDYRRKGSEEEILKHEEQLIKSKSRALKIYSNLKKVKQPISPGGRLTNFINTLFSTGHSKKPKTTTSSVQASSTCYSASSFSRSCLSKNLPSSAREKSRNAAKRTVSFFPVTVIVDEECRPCGHKCLYGEEEDPSLIHLSVPTAWKIGTRRNDDEPKFQAVEKSRHVEEAAREFLKNYHQTQKKNDLVMRDLRFNRIEDEDEERDDDAASCSSSDLFELDHLVVMGNNRYSKELPVYETTHVSTNRAIATGLIM